jgi:hypothetical protein
MLVAARLTRAVRTDARVRELVLLRADDDTTVELLASSKLPWTRGGAPTRWRTATRSAL